MPATRVDVSFAASVVGTAAPEMPSIRANRVARTTNRRTGLLIAHDLHGVGWGGAPTRASGGSRSMERHVSRGRRVWSSGTPLRTAIDQDRLVRTGPVWHRHADCRERLIPERPELEARPQRDREARARVDVDDLRAAILPAPHLTASADEVPDLLD